MANHASAQKRTRRDAFRTALNHARLTRIRTFVRKVEEAIASGNKTAAETALRAVQPELMRGAKRNIIHKNAASRKYSRLTARVKALA